MYYLRPAAAFIRASMSENPLDISAKGNIIPTNEHLAEFFEQQLYELSPAQLQKLLDWALSQNYQMQHFRTGFETSLHKKIINILKGIQPDNFLVVGANRGTILWKILDNFKFISVTATEQHERFFQQLQNVAKGGVLHLKVQKICPQKVQELAPFEYDVVLGIELLNYCQDWRVVLSNFCRLARRFMIFDISNFPLANPRFKQYIEEKDIKIALAQENIFQLRVENIANHQIIIARK